ncbi:hypothetical protein [Methylorubrum extorquens]|jgi:hypothetical protein|uniref:hypothetical protein n=1 Tax=Methylorubrum extorquens TaxID=408 RepID=UPI002236FE64|nr:hypothetical protein [Methylorubrum extorquens]UYW27682.1 hypothetical protein OKC48_03995 [Methylorubrum extorquens]UYW32418.1 hypothetical protein OKB92_26210 [Methylorubrum extorquens]
MTPTKVTPNKVFVRGFARTMARIFLIRPVLPPLLLLGCCAPAHATALPAVDAAALVLPWGDAVVALAQGLSALLTPVLVAAFAAVLARFGGPLRLLVTDALVERLVRNATDYALNAVAGAVQGRRLTVSVGSAVIARAVQRALDQAPAWLIRAAGGGEGVAEKVFRSLPLEAAATAGNTLEPALQHALGQGSARETRKAV